MGFKIETYRQLEQHLQAQLKTGNIAPKVPTFFQSALDAKQKIAEAGQNHALRMACAAKYGAVFKQWEHMLIVHITAIALRGAQVSRANVRNWQQALFGKSMASAELARYAERSRGPEVKIPAIAIDSQESLTARDFFNKHRHSLRAKANPEKFLALHGNQEI